MILLFHQFRHSVFLIEVFTLFTFKVTIDRPASWVALVGKNLLANASDSREAGSVPG